MANNSSDARVPSFTDFPEDIQVCILSLLGPSEIATLACTSKRLGLLCAHDSKLWFSMCERRWGSCTRIAQWGKGRGTISYKHLYNTLHHWENLLGFWRRFQNELVAVDVCFMGKTHFVVEGKDYRSSASGDDCGEEAAAAAAEVESGSPPEKVMAEIYQHFANRRSPGGDRSRRQRRREKERLARRRRLEPQHFVKIVNCSPTPARPLQGLWKGICDDMSLAFYLVVYDDIGGIACRRIGDPPEHFSVSGHAPPVFWTSNATFLESPFSPEEESLYDSRVHLQPLQPSNEILEQFPLLDGEVVNRMQQILLSDNVVNRILHISSSYDLVVPDLAGTINPRSAEGRIWQYQNGTFGFGFLSDNFVVDMKHIIHNGCIVDAVNSSSD
uniref:F-box protein n=1 Tax=Cajanus cajan TaxID=3821 RepID=A0A151SQR0_CAJCA|nr:F-box protein At3g12350 family [Cajanus cajan]